MSPPSSVTLHVLPPSHPSHAAAAALDYKGIEFERVEMTPGERRSRMARMRQTVREHNIYRWAGLLLGELARLPGQADLAD